MKFRAKFDWSCTTNTISISRCVSLEIRAFYRKLSSRKRGNSLSVFYKIPLKYSNYQRLNSTAFDFLRGERKTQNYAPLQRRATNNHTNSQSYKILIESTYSDLPCYLKVNRGKLALINHPWKSKKGKNRRLPSVHSWKLAEHDNFTRAVSRRFTAVRDRKIWTALRTNQIAGFVTVPSWKKIKIFVSLSLILWLKKQKQIECG